MRHSGGLNRELQQAKSETQWVLRRLDAQLQDSPGGKVSRMSQVELLEREGEEVLSWRGAGGWYVMQPD